MSKKSHKSKYGHRFNPEIVEGSQFKTTYGGDFAFERMFYSVKCKVCGRTEMRVEYL